jgi:hypothetical protein
MSIKQRWRMQSYKLVQHQSFHHVALCFEHLGAPRSLHRPCCKPPNVLIRDSMSERSIERAAMSPSQGTPVIRNSGGASSKTKSYDTARARRNRSVLMSESESEIEESKQVDLDDSEGKADPTKGSFVFPRFLHVPSFVLS